MEIVAMIIVTITILFELSCLWAAGNVIWHRIKSIADPKERLKAILLVIIAAFVILGIQVYYYIELLEKL